MKNNTVKKDKEIHRATSPTYNPVKYIAFAVVQKDGKPHAIRLHMENNHAAVIDWGKPEKSLDFAVIEVKELINQEYNIYE